MKLESLSRQAHSLAMRVTHTGILAVLVLSPMANAATSVPVPDMPVDRVYAVAVALGNGKVLVAGGEKVTLPTDSLSAAHLYDPATGAWTTTGSMTVPRARTAAAALLADGRVFVVGGSGGTHPPEIYDPASGSWSATSSVPGRPFFGATATLLGNGKVLVIGRSKIDGSGEVPALYDPLGDSWSVTGPMSVNRVSRHTATRLADGRVLVVGGRGGGSPFAAPVNGAELYDPLSNTWTSTASMSHSREDHAAALLSDGRVLAVSGIIVNTGPGLPSDSAELFDPVAETWSAVAPMPMPRMLPTASILPSGKVLVAGGRIDLGTTIFSTDIFDPGSGTWSLGPDLNSVRFGHTAAILSDGRVLVAGGAAAGSVNSPQVSLATAEVFDESAFGPVIGGGRRPALDFFLAYAGTHVKDRTTTIFNTSPGAQTQVVIFLVVAGNGETVFPATVQMTLNGTSVALPALPAQGVVPIRVALTETSNVLLATTDGVIPGTANIATDSDRLVLKCDPGPP